jgi:DNA-binding beta-propeller fold protein YncE
MSPDRSDLAPVLGVRVDTARNSVWITTSALPNVPGFRAADSANASLLRIDLASRTIRQRFDVPWRSGGHVLGDLAVGTDGSVYVTDSKQPVIYRLKPGAASLDELRSPLFYSLQGIAPTPDGKLLYIADYSLGLLRMDLATGTVVALANPANGTAVGCDGIAWFDGDIIAVQNGVEPARVVRLVPDTAANRLLRVEVVDQNVAVADEPTIGTILGGEFIYVANSQWAKFTDDARRETERPLTAPIALRVPLRR